MKSGPVCICWADFRVNRTNGDGQTGCIKYQSASASPSDQIIDWADMIEWESPRSVSGKQKLEYAGVI